MTVLTQTQAMHRLNAGRGLVVSALAAFLAAACASSGPAPVINRAPVTQVESGPAVQVPPPVAAAPLGPGQYLVKKGDTLYGIALDHGQSYRDLAAWNALSDPNHIQVGQVLRVQPPGSETAALPAGEAVAQPVNLGGEPDMAATTHATTPPQSAASLLKTSPKGGKRPHTPTALAELRAEEAAAASTTTLTAAPAITPVVAAAGDARPATSEVKPAAAEGVQWSWPAHGRVIEPYAEGGNKGIDLAGKTGEPVLAAASGKVILVSNSLRGYGNFVIVKHSNLFLSVYAHNSRILVKEEQTVSKGQKIAEIGSSDTDQPKLHFEIRRQGKPVDPAKYLPAR